MPRKLVWIETQSFVGFSCSDCQWVFRTTSALIGKSFDQMKQAYEAERDQEFAAHDCFNVSYVNEPYK